MALNPSSRANPGRVAAVRALIAVDQGAHAEDALADNLPAQASDRGLAWFITLGVLRRRAHVDAALRPHLSRPLGSLDTEVRAALRAGAFEKLFGRAAPYAVVQQAVEVADAVGLGRAKGMVNAVLRRVESPGDLSPAEAVDHPGWLYARWAERYGAAAADEFCRANNEPPALSLVTATAEPPMGLDVASVEFGGQRLPRVWRVTEPEGAVTSLPGFADGRFWVQDPASVAVADLCGVVDGLKVLDACAAPGGKAFRLASNGAHVHAVDVHPDRLRLLQDSAERLRMRIPTKVHDWERGNGPFGDFPVVLLDAPCTALGTVRRHPEVRWRRQPDDIATVAKRQARILRNVANHVSPGGVLVYAVCSPEPEEGTEVVRAFAKESGWEIEVERPFVPSAGDEDAFFAARLRRR